MYKNCNENYALILTYNNKAIDTFEINQIIIINYSINQ